MNTFIEFRIRIKFFFRFLLSGSWPAFLLGGFTHTIFSSQKAFVLVLFYEFEIDDGIVEVEAGLCRNWWSFKSWIHDVYLYCSFSIIWSIANYCDKFIKVNLWFIKYKRLSQMIQYLFEVAFCIKIMKVNSQRLLSFGRSLCAYDISRMHPTIQAEFLYLSKNWYFLSKINSLIRALLSMGSTSLPSSPLVVDSVFLLISYLCSFRIAYFLYLRKGSEVTLDICLLANSETSSELSLLLTRGALMWFFEL